MSTDCHLSCLFVALFLVDVVAAVALLLAEVVNVDVAFLYADVLLIVVVVLRVLVGLLLAYLVIVDRLVVLLLIVGFSSMLVVTSSCRCCHSMLIMDSSCRCCRQCVDIVLSNSLFSIDVVVTLFFPMLLSIVSMDLVNLTCCRCALSMHMLYLISVDVLFDALAVLDLFRCRGRCACCT